MEIHLRIKPGRDPARDLARGFQRQDRVAVHGAHQHGILTRATQPAHRGRELGLGELVCRVFGDFKVHGRDLVADFMAVMGILTDNADRLLTLFLD